MEVETGTIERNMEHKTGDCQNYGPFLGTLSLRRHIIIGIQQGTIIF